MAVSLIKLKEWKLVCPKCNHIEESEAKGKTCGNCNGSASAYYGATSTHWSSIKARQSYRKVKCDQDCGWSYNKTKCSECGTTIQGDFIQGKESGCFVATACFEDADHPAVIGLRQFRDAHLSRYSLGVRFISWYYRRGPVYAAWVSDKPIIKRMLRVVLARISNLAPK